MTLDDAGQLGTALAGIAALITLICWVIEYRRQGALRRSEYFHTMRRHFKEKELFVEVCNLLETDDPSLAETPFRDKREFLGFFEEVALGLYSGILRREVAHYMFGYYVIQCWNSVHFWKDVNRDSCYWLVFKRFAEDMKSIESELTGIKSGDSKAIAKRFHF